MKELKQCLNWGSEQVAYAKKCGCCMPSEIGYKGLHLALWFFSLH